MICLQCSPWRVFRSVYTQALVLISLYHIEYHFFYNKIFYIFFYIYFFCVLFFVIFSPLPPLCCRYRSRSGSRALNPQPESRSGQYVLLFSHKGVPGAQVPPVCAAGLLIYCDFCFAAFQLGKSAKSCGCRQINQENLRETDWKAAGKTFLTIVGTNVFIIALLDVYQEI